MEVLQINEQTQNNGSFLDIYGMIDLLARKRNIDEQGYNKVLRLPIQLLALNDRQNVKGYTSDDNQPAKTIRQCSDILNIIDTMNKKPNTSNYFEQVKQLILGNKQTFKHEKMKLESDIFDKNSHIFLETYYFICNFQSFYHYQKFFLCFICFIHVVTFLNSLIFLLFMIYIAKVFFVHISISYNRKIFFILKITDNRFETFEQVYKSLNKEKESTTIKNMYISPLYISPFRVDSAFTLKKCNFDSCIDKYSDKILNFSDSCNLGNDVEIFFEEHDEDYLERCDNKIIGIFSNELHSTLLQDNVDELNCDFSRNELLPNIRKSFNEPGLLPYTGIVILNQFLTYDNIDVLCVLKNENFSLPKAETDLLYHILVEDLLVTTRPFSKSFKYLLCDHVLLNNSEPDCGCGNIYRDISEFIPISTNIILIDSIFVTTQLNTCNSILELCCYALEDSEIGTVSEHILNSLHKKHRPNNCSNSSKNCKECTKCAKCVTCNNINPRIILKDVSVFDIREERLFQQESRRYVFIVQSSTSKQLCTHESVERNVIQRSKRENQNQHIGCIQRFCKDRPCSNQYVKHTIPREYEGKTHSYHEKINKKKTHFSGQKTFQEGFETTGSILVFARILERVLNCEDFIQNETVVETDKAKAVDNTSVQQEGILADTTFVLKRYEDKQSSQSGNETNRVSKERKLLNNGNERDTRRKAENYTVNQSVQRSVSSNKYTEKRHFQINRPNCKHKGENSAQTAKRLDIFNIGKPCTRVLTLCHNNEENLVQWNSKLQNPIWSLLHECGQKGECNRKGNFKSNEKVNKHQKQKENLRRWDNKTECIHGNLPIQKKGQKLPNRTKLQSKRLCTRYKQAKCNKQTLCKNVDKLICTGAIGSLAFIGTLLIRAGIEQNPGPWNGQTNKDELRQSENYVWKTGDALGRGATAVVYKARSKHTRDVVAVKVFHDRVSTQFANVALREIEVLRKLKHRNVISILCTEQEMNTGCFVLVMELCTGGSLYSMLDQPKFAFGFPEEEFLLVIKDIAEGMKYIRQQEYVHRDIKPGNIMRFIDEKGSSVYKFTDFGAARQLDEQESFSSIYGTEEYLDPDMYQKAVLRQHIGTFFDASVDLWSLGVTMYHVATGFLPFQPYGGRSNTATMFKITSEKESGVISGIQSEENGPIKWSKELPKSCMLSSNLKSLITPMLAGMMESNRALRWSFEKFFDYVHTIVNMVSLKVFYSSRGCNLKIYIDGKSRFAALQEHIAMETEIPASEQLLIFNNKELKEVIDATSEIQSYSKNILEGQLFLFNKERYQQDTLIIPDILAFPAIQSFRNYDRDSHIAHSSCAVAYYTDKLIAWLIDAQKLMKQADTLLRDYISRITSRIDDSLPDMYRLLGETNKRQATFYSSYEQVLSLYKILSKTNRHSKTIGPICEEAESKLAKILTDRSAQDVIQKAENRAEEIKVYTSVLIEKLKEQEQEAISNSVGCLDTDKCQQKSKNICLKIQEIWSTFQKHRKQPLTPFEQENHSSDRLKLSEHCANLSYVLQSHCLYNYQTLHRAVVKQEFLLVKNIQRTKKVDANIWSVIECQGKISARIDKLQEDCLILNKTFVDVLTNQIETSPVLPAFAQTQLTTTSPPTVKKREAVGCDLSVDNAACTSILQQISQEFKSLDDGNLELIKLISGNDLKLKEAKDLAEGCLKEMERVNGKGGHTLPIPDRFVQV